MRSVPPQRTSRPPAVWLKLKTRRPGPVTLVTSVRPGPSSRSVWQRPARAIGAKMAAGDRTSARVGVGMVVRNGGAWLSEAVTDLLGQSYSDLHLVIGDNASTDETEEVCRTFAAADSRVTYLRHPRDLGPAGNYDAVERAAGGELFKWSAADDRYEPEYLRACVDALDANPGAVLSYPQTRIIGPSGEPLGDYDY
jgi:Glycosyl transferase family 2